MKRTAKNNIYHIPVLSNETLTYLKVEPQAWYVDATAGGGGHTQAILKNRGRVLAIDKDRGAIDFLKHRFAGEINRQQVKLIKGDFINLDRYINQYLKSEVNGILFDLGMSTYQIRQSSRGFSFQTAGRLDMRFNQETEISAYIVVNNYSQDKLYEIFRKFGEEHLARAIAVAIGRARTLRTIESTKELADIITIVYKKAGIKTHIHPATKVFQALRIFVNDELTQLKMVLPKALKVLTAGGRLVIISYHSLEDRLVKLAFKQALESYNFQILTRKPVTAGTIEVERNPAARSAKLRALVKIS